MDKMHVEKIVGTGASITVTPGFYPSYIEVLNTEGLCTLKFAPATMAAASGLKQITAGTISLITTLGITMNSDKESFIIGADTDVNVSGEDMTILCFR